MSTYQVAEIDARGFLALTVATTRRRGIIVAKVALAAGLDWDLHFGDGDAVRFNLCAEAARIDAVVKTLRRSRFQPADNHKPQAFKASSASV
ncbi:hypothetical protein QTL95_28240 [Rhizobium sp. S152]|uniref:hypothetical protein n=1 Tax=Rhizobium sp. S152 TaxID=3055038 RepID=UPI0025A9E63C|nr:hypothetical protein [Rhizobium sp. S152]MDM9629778.1 hypothetical protein [Rhizobium sp. S152]